MNDASGAYSVNQKTSRFQVVWQRASNKPMQKLKQSEAGNGGQVAIA